ncbi:histidinol-phosphatase [Bacteroides sp. 224]|uniref:histidinol-phosphatase n=1 Tax=Bacteroides sp. 224 TaxID=2302936 RepID=UPI0013D610F6|nr:histidinol-phosphatase [Bacteroides sp. 224]NDV67167.1 histidinol-phosphatase HisJ family protein [Bacteroides sp. 224]
MSNLTNYHSHCSFCDGRAPLEEFIKEAIKQGFTSYGISSHAPLPFSTPWTMEWEQVPAYLEEVTSLKEKYASQIEIYTGMEIDYLDEGSNPSVSKFRDLPLDYRIGSVHLLHDHKGTIVDIDCSADKYRTIIDEHFSGDVVEVIHLYYKRLLRMIELGGFDIVGHADKMHYNAAVYRPGLLNESWYNTLMQEYFSTIASKGYMVEINTKAFHLLKTFYPNERYFPLLRELRISVLVNSDAHYPDKINAGRVEALNALKKAGYTTVMELHAGNWEEVFIF